MKTRLSMLIKKIGLPLMALAVLAFGAISSVNAASYSWSAVTGNGNANTRKSSSWATTNPWTPQDSISTTLGNTTSDKNLYQVSDDFTNLDLTALKLDANKGVQIPATEPEMEDGEPADVTDHQLLSLLEDGYKGTITVSSEGAKLEMVEGQDLGQSGWLKIINRGNVPYQISMIVTENGAAPDLTDLRDIVQWMRNNGMGDVDIADASTGKLVFTGLSLLTEMDENGSEYSKFVWDFTGYGKDSNLSLLEALTTTADGDGSDGSGVEASQIDVAVVPEPSTWCLLLVALFVLGLEARRRMVKTTAV